MISLELNILPVREHYDRGENMKFKTYEILPAYAHAKAFCETCGMDFEIGDVVQRSGNAFVCDDMCADIYLEDNFDLIAEAALEDEEREDAPSLEAPWWAYR